MGEQEMSDTWFKRASASRKLRKASLSVHFFSSNISKKSDNPILNIGLLLTAKNKQKLRR
jgi:hypothetical protein